MMRIYNGVVFKSDTNMYVLEESGKKPNTVRLLDRDEVKKLELGTDSEPKHITIKHESTGMRFGRELTNISVIGELCGKTIVVFSWKHEE